MKRMITTLVAALLLMSIFTACGSRMDMDENVTPNIAPTATTVPRVTTNPTTVPTAIPKATATPAQREDNGETNNQNSNTENKNTGDENILQDAGEDLERAGDKMAGDAGVIN